MILRFVTKVDANGNRYYLELDTDRKEYCTRENYWTRFEDMCEVTRQRRMKIISMAKEEGYTEVEK